MLKLKYKDWPIIGLGNAVAASIQKGSEDADIRLWYPRQDYVEVWRLMAVYSQSVYGLGRHYLNEPYNWSLEVETDGAIS